MLARVRQVSVVQGEGGSSGDENSEGIPLETKRVRGFLFSQSQTTWLFMRRTGRGQYLQVRYDAGRDKGNREKKD